MIRELTVTEVEQVSGAGFFGDLWRGVKSVVHDVGDAVVKAFTWKNVGAIAAATVVSWMFGWDRYDK